MIIGNHEGAIITAKTKIETVSMTPILAEAMKLRWCLNWIKEQKLQNIIVEMDVESVAMCVLGKFKLAVLDLVVADCLELLSHLFHVNLLCTKRCSTAHTLVGIARNLS